MEVADPAVVRPETIRRRNMSSVLGEIHRDGALTRAELTARLGLSRSTIGALVAELVERQVLHESIPTGGPRAGRPSHVVGPHGDGPYVVAVDVDVTQVGVAAVGIGGVVLARELVPLGHNRHSPAQVAGAIAAAVPRLQRSSGRSNYPEAIGVSVPGTVHRQDGTVGFAPNLEWRHADLGALLDKRLERHTPVSVGNDADLSMLAEHTRGAARGTRDAVFLIGRSGVGAGIMANGAPLRGRDGHAGEIGHNVVDETGPPCHCGKRGCLETYVGAAALLAASGWAGDDPVSGVQQVLDRAREGEPAALAAVIAVARGTGRGLAALVNTLNPELVVLGGSFAATLAIAPEELKSALEAYTLDPPFEALRLTQPGLGADSALLGAAEIAFDALLNDPMSTRPSECPA